MTCLDRRGCSIAPDIMSLSWPTPDHQRAVVYDCSGLFSEVHGWEAYDRLGS